MNTTSSICGDIENSDFESRFLQELTLNRLNFHKDNYDTFFRGPEPKENRLGLKNAAQSVAREAIDFLQASSKGDALKSKVDRFSNFLKDRLAYRYIPEIYFQRTLAEFKQFQFLYDHLADEESRKILMSLLAYKVLGFRKVKLKRNNSEYWDGIEQSKKLDTGLPEMRIPFLTWPLKCFDVSPLGFDMQLYTYAQAIAINFVQKQYVLHRDNVVCKAEEGDVVIDAGGCWGDTALQFACEVGENGHVYTFEFVPTNLNVMNKNLDLNPHLKSRITKVENPVGAKSGELMYFYENGPGSRVSKTKVDDRYLECEIISIDRVVKDKKIKKVDFIKMDVEGSELDALIGAEKTIKKYRPKLAICIYHKPDDYLTIPSYLDKLNLGYRFYIDHHTIYLNETVLFAVPRK